MFDIRNYSKYTYIYIYVPGQFIRHTCLKVNTNWIRTIVDNKYTELVGIDLYLLTYQFLTENKKITHDFNILLLRPWHQLKLWYAVAFLWQLQLCIPVLSCTVKALHSCTVSCSFELWFQTSISFAISCCLAVIISFAISLFTSSHTFSIGFISGEFPGQYNRGIFCLCRKAFN